MAAVTRWVEYSTAAITSTYIGATTSGVGTRGQVEADTAVGDKFTIGPTNNIISINIDGNSYHNIILSSGVDLDARFVARDITEKMHVVGSLYDEFDHATCLWENNSFHIYSGDLGAGSTAAVQSGTNTALPTLGFPSNGTQTGGAAHSWNSNLYNGGISVSGTWEGMFDEVYTILISSVITIASPTPGGSNEYTGTCTAGGQFNHSSDITYVVTVDTTNSPTVGGGTGNVPRFSWTSTGSVDDGGPVEILYGDHWYNIGTKGLKMKWEDSVFGSGDNWTVVCAKPVNANGGTQAAPGTAKYIWTSDRGDECSAAIVTSSTEYTRVGTRGLSVKFVGGSTDLRAGDEFRVVCTAPQPSNYDITSLNYGNVTVTNESSVKCILFEIMSGAVTMDAVKFGLQNHGTFSYHGTGDTYFRYGTVGAGNVAGASPTIGKEWRTGVVASDMSGTKPNYLYAIENDLSVVATADDSESIGVYQNGLVSDFVYLCIRLGADETGSNSGINYRLYFDYS